ncbi:MAG: hypothetical protein RLZZ196_1481 [Bacteroidota bacterium]
MKDIQNQLLRYDNNEYFLFERYRVSYDALNFVASVEDGRLCLYKMSKRITKEDAKEWAEKMRVKAIEEAGEEEGMKRYLDILLKFNLLPDEGDKNGDIINFD